MTKLEALIELCELYAVQEQPTKVKDCLKLMRYELAGINVKSKHEDINKWLEHIMKIPTKVTK